MADSGALVRLGQLRRAARGPLGWLRALTVAALVAAACVPIDNADTFGHLAAGRQISELGHVPAHDSFSFFRDAPEAWVNYEWLSAWLFWQAYALSGPSGLLVLELLVLAVVGLLLIEIAAARGGVRAASLCAALVVLGLPGYRMRFSVRPHVFGFALTALFLLGLDRIAEGADDAAGRRRATRWIAGLALAHVLWVNLHGSHLLGLVLTAAHLVAYVKDRAVVRRLGLLLGLQLAACAVSPYGPAIVLDAIEHVSDPAYRELVGEWSPWRAHHALFAMVALFVQGLWLLLAMRGLLLGGTRGRAALLVSVGFGVMAVRSVRFVAEFMLLAAPLLAAGLVPRLEALSERARRGVLAVALVFAVGYAPLASAHTPPGRGMGWGVDGRELPVLCADWLREHHPQARVFSAMEDGWYLMFAAPSSRQLLDGRVPFYGVEHVTRVRSAFASAAAFNAVVQRFGVDTVLVQHALQGQQPLLATLRARGDFELVAIEDRHALFVSRAVAARVQTARPQAFDVGFDMLGALSAGADAVHTERARLPAHPNACALRAAWQGLESLTGLERPRSTSAAQQSAGFVAATTPEQRKRFVAAAAALGEAVECMPLLPVLRAYHAAAALGACDLSTAEARVDELNALGGSREALLLGQELALRRGQLDTVRAFVQSARAMPEARDDPWLGALEADLTAPPRCP